jgi:L-aminopeptidase/D-esterase-like protein
MVGSLAAQVMSEAIIKAVMSAETAYGFPAAKTL